MRLVRDNALRIVFFCVKSPTSLRNSLSIQTAKKEKAAELQRLGIADSLFGLTLGQTKEIKEIASRDVSKLREGDMF